MIVSFTFISSCNVNKFEFLCNLLKSFWTTFSHQLFKLSFNVTKMLFSNALRSNMSWGSIPKGVMNKIIPNYPSVHATLWWKKTPPIISRTLKHWNISATKLLIFLHWFRKKMLSRFKTKGNKTPVNVLPSSF